MSRLSQLAKHRNWSKYRLMGANFPSEGLAPEEKEEIELVKSQIRVILARWDERSRTLGITPRKKKMAKRYEYLCKNCGEGFSSSVPEACCAECLSGNIKELESDE